MVSWAQLILALVQLAAGLLAWRQRAQALSEAQETLVARAAAQLLELTAEGKMLRQHVADLTDAGEVDLWERMLK